MTQPTARPTINDQPTLDFLKAIEIWKARCFALETNLAKARDVIRPFVDPKQQSIQTNAKVIDHTLGGFTPLEITVTKDQYSAARAFLEEK
jgi:hypothetical protein